MEVFSKLLISRMVSSKFIMPHNINLILEVAGEIVAIKKMKKKYHRWDQCIN